MRLTVGQHQGPAVPTFTAARQGTIRLSLKEQEEP